MKEIVINGCYGGFDLSKEAVLRYAEIKGIKVYPYVDSISFEVFQKVYGEEPTIEDHRLLWVSYATKHTENGQDAEDDNYFSTRDIPRDDPALVQAIKELKAKANSKYSKLKIVKIPNNVEWDIEEYDGIEWVSEKHRNWD
jgi:hypothetical protein